MGYDPFDRPDAARERLAVVLVRKGRGYAARVERFDAAGVSTWSETFPKDPLQGDCAALMSPLASELRGVFLGYQGVPIAPAAPAAPAAPPAEPAPTPAPAPPPELRAPPPESVKPPELSEVPNPARALPARVAVVSSAFAGVFLGLGIAWSVDVQHKTSAARALAGQPYAGATHGCSNGQAPSRGCANLLGAWHSEDKAIELRNGWLGAAGVSGAIGLTATFWALSLPATLKAPPRIL